MVIEGKRLLLKNITVADAERLYIVLQDKTITGIFPELRCNKIADVVTLISDKYSKCDFKNEFYFLIEHKDTHIILGCLFCEFDPQTGEKRITLFSHYRYRRDGYIEEALKLFFNICPKDTTFFFYVDYTNTAGINFLIKIGANQANRIKSQCPRDYRFYYIVR